MQKYKTFSESFCNFFGNSKTHIFFIAFNILFVELALIRILGAQIVALSFFSNLILISSFFGIGIGCLYQGKKNLFKLFPYLLSLLIFFCIFEFDINTSKQDVIMFKSYNNGSTVIRTNIYQLIPIIFLWISLLFSCLGQRLGQLINSFDRPIDAYIFDLSGSICGIICFNIFGFFEIDAFFWLATSLIIWYLIIINSKQDKNQKKNFYKYFIIIYLIAFGYALLSKDEIQFWSKYYKIKILEYDVNGIMTKNILVNKIGHQAMISSENLPWIYNSYYQISNKNSFDNILIIGSGSGNDTALALTKKIKQIDAVEIDPRIAKIGNEFHPNKPYQDDRVNLIINDGRNFLNTKKDKKYDLIIFALTDSLTLASSYANTRLESYLFTTESLSNARNLLTEDGAIIFYNYYREKWLIDKMANMISSITKQPVTILVDPNINLASIIAPKNQTNFNLKKLNEKNVIHNVVSVNSNYNKSNFATDDWPFLYLKTKTIPKTYLLITIIIIFLSLLIIFIVYNKKLVKQKLSASSFFLGLSFMLLETKNVTNFQLIFGATWLVNSAVFIGILFFALLSAILTKHRIICKKNYLYLFMAIALLVNFLVPINQINLMSTTAKYLTTCAIVFTPIFIANLIFSNFFKDQKNARIAFGSNLIGAMTGGILEYLAMLSGYHSLLIIISASYLLAFIFASKKINN